MPYSAHDICNQREKLREQREHVMLVVRAYNSELPDRLVTAIDFCCVSLFVLCCGVFCSLWRHDCMHYSHSGVGRQHLDKELLRYHIIQEPHEPV